MIDTYKFINQPVICKPLDTYKELLDFKEHPPSWRSLCTDLKEHSENFLRNCEVEYFSEMELNKPLSFCHRNPESVCDPKHHVKRSLPKTLVCHDMLNGYHDDSIIDGTNACNMYTFYNWAGIDVFCYFSHHFITIPPLSWINVGHDHGVKIIGTIITELAEGTDFWTKVLSSESEMQNCIDTLVSIAKTLKFDGWLLNVENKVTKPEKLLEFVQCLCKSLHEALTDSVLIWYDNVTIDGQLNWQNKLNSKNKGFFDVCDGIFTNYSWTQEDLTESVNAAGARLTDLYIGIDVWGHNFFGGGKFNTQEAVQMVASLGCSLAIFGPSWTHEVMTSNKNEASYIENADNLSYYQKFLLRDRALWDSLWPFLNTRLPSTLPFKTSFCRGQGRKRWFYGDVICPGPWYNLRHMNYQPNAAHGCHGYRLDHVETLTNVCRRETKGIIKLPDSNDDTTNVEMNTEPTTSFSNENETLTKEETEEEGMERKNFKGRIKHFFKVSTSKDEPLEPEDDPNDIEGNYSTVSTGQSMLTIDVNIQLAPCTDIKTRVTLSHFPEELECLEFFQEDSFMGGSCLKINPSDCSSDKHRTIILFHCDFICEATMIVCVVTKTLAESENQYLNVHLYAKDNTGKDIRVILVGRNVPLNSERSTNFMAVYPLSGTEFSDMRSYIMLNHPEFFVPVENLFHWNVQYFQVLLPYVNITSVNLRTGNPQGAILLGHFGLCNRNRNV